MKTKTIHKAAAKRSQHLYGAWQAKCACGWEGTMFSGKWSKSNAVADKYDHLVEREDAGEQVKWS